MTIREAIEQLENLKANSTWQEGVKRYAVEILEAAYPDMDEEFHVNPALRKRLLDGASDWREYSYAGCSLIYDGDIAERLSPPSFLKRKKGGEIQPNPAESWLDVQARALAKAEKLILSVKE